MILLFNWFNVNPFELLGRVNCIWTHEGGGAHQTWHDWEGGLRLARTCTRNRDRLQLARKCSFCVLSRHPCQSPDTRRRKTNGRGETDGGRDGDASRSIAKSKFNWKWIDWTTSSGEELTWTWTDYQTTTVTSCHSSSHFTFKQNVCSKWHLVWTDWYWRNASQLWQSKVFEWQVETKTGRGQWWAALNEHQFWHCQ